ncbi:hypothetical protein [Deinococcus sp. RIT780]|uniref:hypothetical protein n=1 Tax=Deinococcus sp. RIT780 TaxID=2870472 RepID=UPI001C8A45FA|nr:hypothetical protein [Deinococcus sp. RIT780]MBX8464224.1 hypothetical protein [Deinococcus sp. RIT780]
MTLVILVMAFAVIAMVALGICLKNKFPKIAKIYALLGDIAAIASVMSILISTSQHREDGKVDSITSEISKTNSAIRASAEKIDSKFCTGNYPLVPPEGTDQKVVDERQDNLSDFCKGIKEKYLSKDISLSHRGERNAFYSIASFTYKDELDPDVDNLLNLLGEAERYTDSREDLINFPSSEIYISNALLFLSLISASAALKISKSIIDLA